MYTKKMILTKLFFKRSETDNSSVSAAPGGNTPCKMRPGNPTPLHAEGQATPNIVPTPILGQKISPDKQGEFIL